MMSIHARRRSIKQPSTRLYAVYKNVHRLSQRLRSHNSRLNLRSPARSFLHLFQFSHTHLCRMLELYLVLHRCQQFNHRLRIFLPSSEQSFSATPPGFSGSGQVMRSSSRSTAPGDLGFTPEQIDAAPPIDLGLENLLRQCDVKEPVIQAFRVRGITDRFLFVALDETTEGLRNTCREALGVDTNLNFEHKLEFAKISKAWSSAKIAAGTKEKIDAVHRAHGEPVQMLEGDWVSLIRAFKVKYGKTFTRPDYRLRATTSHTKKNFRILPGEQNPLPTLSASRRKKSRRPYARSRLVVSGSIWTAPSRFKHSAGL